jgi:hypothetical protein
MQRRRAANQGRCFSLEAGDQLREGLSSSSRMAAARRTIRSIKPDSNARSRTSTVSTVFAQLAIVCNLAHESGSDIA